MPWSIVVGRVAGTAIRIHVTFLILLAWIGFSAFRTGGGEAAASSVVFILALFLCVLLHEFGHIFMARRFGIATPDVTLLPIGGVASLERIPDKPREQLAVALAGPAVNVVIAFILIAILGTLAPADISRIDDPSLGLVAKLASANIFLVVFNMIPAFPMDGGRVLHAVLSMNIGPQRAMRISSRIGQGLAFVLGFLGLFGNPLLIFIAIFVYVAAAGEAQDSEMRFAFSGLRVSDAMETRFATVPADATLEQAVEILLATPQHEFPVVDGLGKPVGLIVRDDLIAALRDRERGSAVIDIARSPFEGVRATAPLEGALEDMRTSGARAISVVDASGELVGMLTPQNIAEMLLVKQARPDWRFGRG
ncbi:MAG: site-2 protease family protein [Beijerinckiaceae bacterium]|jgi:Zn-dependent protease/CBS domain-containing protein|nr:site-2 protease family protein [Beijerinckiaceae bacterium]